MCLSCSDYNKILKGSDYNLKYEKALEYYENNQCYKSLPLFEELMSYFRMTSKGKMFTITMQKINIAWEIII